MLPQIKKKNDDVVFINHGTVIAIPFPALVKGLLEAGFDVVIPERDSDADKLYRVELKGPNDTLEVKVSGKNPGEAILNAINHDDNRITFDSVKAVFIGYPPSNTVSDITVKVISKWEEQIKAKKEMDETDETPKEPAPEAEAKDPEPEHVSTEVKELEDPFKDPAPPEPAPAPQPIQTKTELVAKFGKAVDKKARQAACKEQGEECQFCKKNPETCDGKYQPPF